MAVEPMKYHHGFNDMHDAYELQVWVPEPEDIDLSGRVPAVRREHYAVSYRAGWDGEDWAVSHFERFNGLPGTIDYLHGLPINTTEMVRDVVGWKELLS